MAIYAAASPNFSVDKSIPLLLHDCKPMQPSVSSHARTCVERLLSVPYIMRADNADSAWQHDPGNSNVDASHCGANGGDTVS